MQPLYRLRPTKQQAVTMGRPTELPPPPCDDWTYTILLNLAWKRTSSPPVILFGKDDCATIIISRQESATSGARSYYNYSSINPAINFHLLSYPWPDRFRVSSTLTHNTSAKRPHERERDRERTGEMESEREWESEREREWERERER